MRRGSGRQWQIPQPKTPIRGVTAPTLNIEGPVMPTQPEVRQSLVPFVYRYEGFNPSVYSPYVPVHNVQRYRGQTYAVQARTAPRSARTPPSQSAVPPWNETRQPEGRFWPTNLRYVVEAEKRLHQGALVQGRFEPSPYFQPFYPDARQHVGGWVPILGPPAPPAQTDVFALWAMPVGYDQRPAPRLIYRIISAPAFPIPFTPALTRDPEKMWWQRLVPRQAPISARLDQGASIQPLFFFRIDQPDRGAWYYPRPNAQSYPPPRFEGVKVDSDFFPSPTQEPAGLLAYRVAVYIPEVYKQFTGVFTPPPVAQTYIFPPNQPDRAQWYVPRMIWDPQEPDKRPHEGAAIVAPQLNPVPKPMGPDIRWWRETRQEALVRSVTVPYEAILPITEGERVRLVLYLMQHHGMTLKMAEQESHNFYIVQRFTFDEEL